MDEYCIDNEDLQVPNPNWHEHEWIGCGRTFHNVPRLVAVELVRKGVVPPEYQSLLPSEKQSPTDFYTKAVLPVWNERRDSKETLPDVVFVSDKPSYVPTSLMDLPMLPQPTIRRLEESLGQAWFDNMKSIRVRDVPRQETRFLPFWWLSFAKEVRRAALSWHHWQRAIEWRSRDDEQLETDELVWRERAFNLLSAVVGWKNKIGCGLGDLTFERLADLLGNNMLNDGVVDALLADVVARLSAHSGLSQDIVIADTFFSQCIQDGTAWTEESFGYPIVAKYTALLTSVSPPPILYFPLYSPPIHWAACHIDVQASRIQFGDSLQRPHPKQLCDELVTWLQMKVGLRDHVSVSDDLSCAVQSDSVNCGIIAANTIAHHVLGDPLWDPRNAHTNRYKVFCTIAAMILRHQGRDDGEEDSPWFDRNPWSNGNSTVSSVAGSATGATAAVDVENVNGHPPLTNRVQVTDEDVLEIINELDVLASDAPPAPPASATNVPAKREREDDSDELPPAKWARKATSSRPSGAKSVAELKETALVLPHFKILNWVQHLVVETLRTGGQSNSAKHDRVVSLLIRHGLYRGNTKRLAKLKEECKKHGGDPNLGVDINNPKQVTCFRCQTAIQLQSVYQARRFREHWKKQSCKKGPSANKSITSFFGVKPTASAQAGTVASASKSKPQELVKSCPGLTGAIDPRIDHYIQHCPATGAGSREITHYVRVLFEETLGIVSIRDPRLKASQRAKAYHHQALDRSWRIETSPHCASVNSTQCLTKFPVSSQQQLADPTVVCPPCLEVLYLRAFLTAINRKRDKPHGQLKCTPKLYANPIQSRLMAKYEGLEEFLNKKSEHGYLLRFIHGVIDGHYKDHKVFLGLVETMVLAKDRQLKGVGMQNFKYPPAFQEWGAMIRMSSPRAYRNMAQQFRMESERSIKHRQAQRARFPIGITVESFDALQHYCNDYNYPAGYPLCLSVDDTKLYPSMQPLHDGPKQQWFLMGLPGEKQLTVATPAELEKLMDQKHVPATKLRLLSIQIPFPGIPPLAFAVLPIDAKIKGPELTKYQLKAMHGLVERKFRFISNVADGAAVELDCQSRVAASGTKTTHRINPPSHLDEPPILIPLYSLDGNTYINTQDAPHARKTGRNNGTSGARCLTLGDFVVYYKQFHDLATAVSNPPLYERDVIDADKQDDNAAIHMFSAATLHALAENIEDNMGAIVFLFIIGELIDAYESRTMRHTERAKAAIRARLFFSTWKRFLQKQGYSQARHYISAAADRIYHTLIDGLLGLIIIHRDHLSSPTIPLLPWKHESMGNERIFAALRDLFPDMSLVQALLALPHIRATMTSAKHALFSKGSFKKVANGYSFCDASDDKKIDFANLMMFPSDAQLSTVYGDAIEENDLLWSLLNVHVRSVADSPSMQVPPAPADQTVHPEHIFEDDLRATEAAIVDLGIQEELDQALAAVQNVTGLLRGEEEELDACAYAAAALVVESLVQIDDLPQLTNPELLEISRQDIAKVVKMTPQSVESFLGHLKVSFGGTSKALDVCTSVAGSPLLDITASDLRSLVKIRETHQIEHARVGVRSYKPLENPSTTTLTITGKKKLPPSEKQLLAQRIQSVIRNAEARKATTGLNRKARTEQAEAELAPKLSGNAANAAAAANVRAVAAVRRRRTLAQTLRCQSLVAEAGIAPMTPLEPNTFIFVIEHDTILLGRVITMYSKGGGKLGKHGWIPAATSIGEISYVSVQTYEHSAGRSFRRVHVAHALIGVSRFAHLPPGSILMRIPDKVYVRGNLVEISSQMALTFKTLQQEKAGLVRMVTTLNTVQRKGQTNINVMDIELDDDVDM